MTNSITTTTLLLAGITIAACKNSTGFKGGLKPKSPKAAETTPTVDAHPDAPHTPPPSDPGPPDVRPPDQEIRFGIDSVYRIGDNSFSGSSCKDQVAAYGWSGTRYFFEFQVLEPQTMVDISLNKLCGVDSSNSNVSKLVSSFQTLQVQPITPMTTSISFNQVYLEPGRYAVVVESNKQRNFGYMGDHDDFLIGDIMITANKKIDGGRVRTER